MLKDYFSRLNNNWSNSWTPQVRNHFIGSLALLISIVYLCPDIFDYYEHRDAALINDPILALITPRDFSVLIFTLIYSGLLASIIHHLVSPIEITQWIQAYTLIFSFRILCIFLLPLAAPEDIIILVDPVVDNIIGSQRTLTKDLFFSGHTSTAFLYFLFARNKILKGVLLMNCIAIATLLLWQHVHYSVDVLVAPIFAFFFYGLQKRFSPLKSERNIA
ncbi:MAG: hypothetical protein ACI94Y_003286 [Maribacter sp.]|jgi:hypothetical protein